MFNHPILKPILFPWIIGCFQTSFEPLANLVNPLWPFWHFFVDHLWRSSKSISPQATSGRQALQPSGYSFIFNFWPAEYFKNYIARPGKANFTLRVWNDRWRNIFSSISRGSRLLMFFSPSPISVLNVAFDQYLIPDYLIVVLSSYQMLVIWIFESWTQ